ncbi:unnamed protein product [Sordaria macrospora k-hell]|uniref:WGS project CABT00000000 data, contig 2.12 n=1 Tax=Sordaria macrospora (strain ATCC MYA-333 / DSM 997 / K(L3346) / K-hell) TaxID=771870 RepID=F7VY34_SORMK|nr:uncharacterized protein SMAC_02999 [Sordaria macrospora k-hell]CCC10428.1 unnamed protein product [Sordaria macrospora k-hell]
MATGVDAKLLKSTKFPPEFNQKVDMQKVNIQVMKKQVPPIAVKSTWIASKVTGILANEDDVVIELVFNLLESGRYPDIKSMQIQLTGFLDKDTPTFCKDLWKLLLSAQTSPQGVPKELLEAKKMELIQEKRTKLQKRHDRSVKNSNVDLRGAAAGEEAVWVVAAATPGVEDAVMTVEVAVADPARHHVSVIRETVARQEEDSEIHMSPEEAQHSDVVEDDGTTGGVDLALGRRLCGRGPVLARGHLALTEGAGLLLDPLALLQDGDGQGHVLALVLRSPSGDRISVSDHHRHGADPDTGGAPDPGLARFHPIVVPGPERRRYSTSSSRSRSRTRSRTPTRSRSITRSLSRSLTRSLGRSRSRTRSRSRSLSRTRSKRYSRSVSSTGSSRLSRSRSRTPVKRARRNSRSISPDRRSSTRRSRSRSGSRSISPRRSRSPLRRSRRRDDRDSSVDATPRPGSRSRRASSAAVKSPAHDRLADDPGAQDRIRSPHDTTSAAEADQNVKASYEQRQKELKEKIKQMRSSRSAEGDHEANKSF